MKKVYDSIITIANPIIKGHTVYGQPLLPGLAYIDMLYQLVQDAMGLDFKEHCLKRLYISNPLIVKEDQPVKISISFERISNHWKVVVEGTETDIKGNELQEKLYMSAELHEETIALGQQINIEAMKQAATQCVDIETVYAQAQTRELVHQGIVKAKGKIYLTEPGCLIEVNMDDKYLNEVERFLLQPTLIDAAALAAVEVLVSNGDAGNNKDLYLPLVYESFYFTEPIHTKCYAIVSLSSLRKVNEISTMDIVFFNIDGKQIGVLQGFTVKRVRFMEQISQNFIKETNLTSIKGPRAVFEISPQHDNNCTKEDAASTHIESLLVRIFTKHLNLEADEIDLDKGFFELGLQSSQLLAVMEDIEKALELSISPTLLFEHTTIGELSAYFTEKYAVDRLGELSLEYEQEPASDGAASNSYSEDVPSAEQSAFANVAAEHCASRKINHEGAPTKKDAANEEEIAIIGMAGRFPGAKNIREFWFNLLEGKDCVSEIPESRWDWHQFDGLQSPSGKDISRWGGFIDDPDCFDPRFFRISPREAETMDPQERLFLETCWEAIEDAGYTPGTLVPPRGPNKRFQVGVFVGVMHKDYSLVGAESLAKGQRFPLSLNYAPIANRVSYFCNFHGPSMAVDTVCSSSLTALHLALESIRRGESEVVLTGGVNLSLHSNKYLSYGINDMYASDGRCHTFGRGGNGYVSGEAVGAVVLKPLHKAIEDQDQIYAVIKGSTINHVGTVSGIMVPSPTAQADVIMSCLEKTGINPRTISYVEAHGTGTSLGDPIEIEGLIKAYRQYTQELQFCSIGSLKSNIGHTEAAAGISGLIKVVLQLYNKTLVPSLHSEELNPYIDFENSPFYVQHKTEEWKQPTIPENTQQVRCHRRAGLSSFGATGSNAHIILEEYIPKETHQQTPVIVSTEAKPTVILLSAKNEERLKAYTVKLLQFLREATHLKSQTNLADIAYTLQVGRIAMEERAAFIVQDIAELTQKLEAFLQDKKEIENFYRGHVTKAKNTIALFTRDEDSQELFYKWMAKGKFDKVADLWVKGLEVDWGLLYGETRPHRISLPTYPFARERYWVPKNETKSVGNREVDLAFAAFLHPLLHQNTSDLSEQRYTSNFTGQEFFLTDHVIKGRKVLPGVAYLEMAREAVARSTGLFTERQSRVQLKNVVWIKPITVGEHPVRVHIGIYPDDDGGLAYEIYSRPIAVDSESVIHSQGRAALIKGVKTPALNLTALQAQCGKSTISSVQCYEVFKAMGISYGPGHRGIEEIYVGKDQILAKLSLPSSVSGTKEQYVLHPSMLDCALQASIGIMLGPDQMFLPNIKALHSPVMPFAMQELEVLGRCTPKMWALIRYSKGSIAGDKVQKFDVDLCDEQGTICVRIKGFTTRILEGSIQTGIDGNIAPSKVPIEPPIGTFMLSPLWDSVPVVKERSLPSPTDRIVIVGGTKDNRDAIRQLYPRAEVLEIQSIGTVDELAKRLDALDAIDHIVWIAPQKELVSLVDDTLIEEQDRGVLQVFKVIKALLRLGYGSRDLGWTVITTQTQRISNKDRVNPTHASIHGLIGSMAKEYPNWEIRLIDLELGCRWPVNDIFTLPIDQRGHAWAYRNNEWYRQQLIPFQRPPLQHNLYQKGGIYVVIGGAGSIGEAWSEYMIRTYQAQIIWIGRREKDAVIQAKLDKLAALGSAPHYITADASNLQELQKAYEEIKRGYPQIHGLIHSAMVFTEQGLANMEEEQFKAGLSAKVDVTVNMARVFSQEPLKFVVFFSSMISFIKNPKQSHYASGCTFTDAFAHQLAHEWPCAVKVMNWGYWATKDAAASEDLKMLAQIGVGLIEPKDGMQALETLFAAPINQIALMKTTRHLAVEGMNYQESVTIYQEKLPSILQNVMKHSPDKGLFAECIKAETDRQTKAMDELLCRLLWGQLQSIGLFTKKKMVAADLKTGLHPLYDRWLDESITILSRHNYLEHAGETCYVFDSALTDMDTVWKRWDLQKGVWLEDPSMKSRVILIEAVLRALPEILTGKVPVTEVMFPNSSMELVEEIYKNNVIADYFNEVLADTVVTYIQERLEQDSSAQIRIIEIGAGTGGTSAMVFQKLKPYRDHIQEYCYTDISKAFLLHAEKEYGPQNPYLTYKIFNLNTPAAGQDIGAGEFDIAIAANVLHATRNIRQTLHNTKAVLKNNGLLLLNEITYSPLYIHLTFGLLEGWWLYEDHALRIPGCPGLYPETWEVVLESEGFRSVSFPAKSAHDLGQQIIAAESNGVVRQQRKLNVTPLKKNIKVETHKKQAHHQEPLTASTQEITQELLREKSIAYIKQLVGETLKISSNRIDSSEPLETYGIDSIMVVRLTNSLRNTFKNISTTLFFEHQTIDALAEHFMQTQRDSLISLLGPDDQKHYDDVSADGGLSEEQLPVHRGLSLRKSQRLMQFREPKIVGPEPQPTGIQDVAIIGLSIRNAGANDANEFWVNLKEARNCITEIPKDRWDWKQYYDRERRNSDSIYTQWGGFIKDYDKFDPLFFHITPREAEEMDPQERLFLETAYASMEDAGYAPDNLCESRKVGVFVGVMNGDYPTGTRYWSIANRISYLFNFQGPSIAVDTACSSSLTAIHLALESLYSGTSKCAIAGGVNLIVTPEHLKRLSAKSMISPGDHCKAFGDEADGFVDGEGVGAIVLKPLHDAIADADHIYGIIKASMINSGGKTNGYTVPNPNAQFQLISEALQRAKVHPRTVSYLEAHGTGTALGDPIEIAGLTRAFEQDTKDKQFCAIGSVKPNIGHCESAAGVSGVAKILLQLKHKQLVPSLHSKVPNPNIDFSNTPFVVQQELAEWKRPVVEIGGITREYPRIAGVSSFGAGGSNAHIVIEEYISDGRDLSSIAGSTKSPVIILLSAKNEERLRERVRQLRAFINQQQFSDADLADMAYTLQVGREAMEERLAMVVGSVKELEGKLKDFMDGRESVDIYRGQVKQHKKTLAVFTADEDLEKTIDAWIAKEKYAKLLNLWVNGLHVNWNNLNGDVKPRRISLPTYPFARDRYWVRKKEAKSAGNTVSSTVGGTVDSTVVGTVNSIVEGTIRDSALTSMDSLKDFFYIPGWKHIPLTGDQKDKADKIGRRNVVIIYPSGSSGIEKALARCYGKDQVFFVKLGAETRRDEGGWEINTGNPMTMDNYIREIKDIDTIYFLGGIETGELADDLETFERSQKQGVLSLFHLLKSLIRQGLSRKSLQLKIITNNVHQVGPEQEIKPFAAGLIGFGKSIAMEFPDMEVSCIDISLERRSSREEIEAIAGHVFREPGHSKAEEVAIRDGRCYVRTIEPVLLPPAKDLPLKTKGVYVILGGAGGIGLELSRFLAERAQARLVLIGRRKLNHQMKARISEIESKGGQVLYLMADATDPMSMRNAIDQAKHVFGRINGVVHSAMTLNDYTLENMSEEDFMSGLVSKTIGSLVTYQVTKDEPLDFMLFFSSVASFLPSVGASNYSVGVTFEDSFARYLNHNSSFPVKTINWGYWGNIGGGARQGLNKLFTARGIEAHSVEEGMEAICRILGSHAEQFIAVKANRRFLGNIGLDSDHQVELYPIIIPSVKIAAKEKFVPTMPDERLIRYDQSLGKLEELSRYQLIDSFNRMGIFLKAGERYQKEELKAKLKIMPSYWRLYEAVLVILTEAGFIDDKEDQVITTEKLEEACLKEELIRLKDKREEIVSALPEVENHLKLLWTCHDSFFEVLRGEIPATDVIFPNASMTLVEGVYQGHPAADYFNSMVARFIRQYIEERLPRLKVNQKIKILEIGAGIGATSTVVFQDIKRFGEKLTYYYTDISPVFTRYGSEKYSLDNPYLEFKVLNIENEVTDQGFDPGEIDVVIAANVIHATRNISHTLRNIKRLLKRNGLLVLNELTGLQVLLSATFALLDGWWLYEDQENRIEGSPMLEPATWEKLLRAEGFNKVRTLGAGQALKTYSQHVIIGESDGAVRYKMAHTKAADSADTAVYNSAAAIRDDHVEMEYDSAPSSRETLRQAIAIKMVDIIAGVTQIDTQQIDPDLPFNELGVDSIFAAEIVSRINDEFSFKLKTNDLLNHPNIQLFVDFVIEGIGDAGTRIQKPMSQFGPRINKEIYVKSEKSQTAEPVAIIGFGGVMPNSEDLESYWVSLVEGKNLITEIPPDRWDWKEYYGDPIKEANKTGSKWGGFIKHIDKFDTSLFNISPREAKYMDPQQRIFLEVVWNTIESAGYKPSDLAKSKTGVFVGSGPSEYAELISNRKVDIDSLVLTGIGPSLIANRVSHFFDLKGPSEVIDTTCSGSVVAVHRAVNAIRRRECNMAIAGGVSLILSPIGYIGLAKYGMLSNSGVSKPFDRTADGLILGEGAGAILLKPLSRAVEDNDHIYAVIRGSAVNHGGTRGSLISPDSAGQSAVIVSALEDAGVLPETLTYIESHGAGAVLGDTAEIDAYHDAFSKMSRLSSHPRRPSKYCGIGSVKPNIGHLEAASGISALIKVIFALRDKLLPATLNFEESQMLQDDSPFYIVDKTKTWEPIKDQEGKILPRRAGIHSFGFGGTNAHLVLEEYLPETDELTMTSERNEKGTQILVFSAKTDEALNKHIENMRNYLKKARKINLQDVAYTLLVGREAMEERLAIAVNSMDEAGETLDKVLNNQRPENVYMGSVRNNPGNVEQFLDKDLLGEKAIDPAFVAGNWVHGGAIDWKSLGGSRVCKRVSLPTYPFARERYWIDQIEAGNDSVESTDGCSNLSDKMPGLVSDNIGRFVRQLIKIVSDTLEIPAEKIDPLENLKKYGFDSLTAIRMLNRIRETFGEAVTLKDILKNPTIEDFARVIALNGNAFSGREKTSGEDESKNPTIEESGGISPDLKINGEDELFEFLVDELINGRITSGQAAKLASKLGTSGKRGIN